MTANEHKYKLTGALGDLVFEAPNINAVTYPSVVTNNHGVNICLLPEKADAFFRPSKAWEIVVGEQAAHVDVGSPLYGISFGGGLCKSSRTARSNGSRPASVSHPASVAAFIRYDNGCGNGSQVRRVQSRNCRGILVSCFLAVV